MVRRKRCTEQEGMVRNKFHHSIKYYPIKMNNDLMREKTIENEE